MSTIERFHCTNLKNNVNLKQQGITIRCSVKKAALKNFTIFTAKDLCWSLPVNIAKLSRTPILKNICERVLLNNY